MPVAPALKCPSCGSSLQMQDFDVANGIVKCSYCHALMPLSGRSEGFEPSATRVRAEMPKRITVKRMAGGIEIQRQWFTPAVLVFVLFCIAWDGFVFFGVAQMLSKGGRGGPPLFFLIHVGVGLFLTYLTLAKIFNTTCIAVERGLISIKHGPLPWPGQLTASAGEINQLYCKEKKHRSKNGVSYTYEVWAALQSGASKILLGSLPDSEQAIFIEQEIESALDIKDRRVLGEIV